jgi:hypothetical protein
MDGHTEIALCKICNTYVKYQDTDVYIDNDTNDLCIDCTQCMNQIKIKPKITITYEEIQQRTGD